MHANNIAVLPVESATLPTAEEELNPTVVVVTPRKIDQTIVGTILGGSCQLTVCSSLKDFSDLMRRSRDTAPELVLVRDLLIEKDPKALRSIAKSMRRYTPVLVLNEKADMKFATRYAKSGARDIVSMDEAGRMRFVVKRELQDYRFRRTYKRYASRAAKYRRQLKRLNEPTATVDAIGTSVATTIHDRTSFLEQLSKRLAEAPPRGVRVLAWIRPDQFRAVEEALGIIASEESLEHIAGVLRNLQHPEDIGGRIGGTVFAVLLERGTMEEVEAWVQQFCRSLNERPFGCDGKSARLSCTTGLCEIGKATDAMEQVLAEAHDACRRGRMQGDGQIFLSAGSKSARSARLQDRKWAKRIKRALRKDHFRLIHSPIVRLDGQNDKVRDTWVRMIDEKGNKILPGEFMPVAKRLGLMTLIDRWIIAATLSYCIKRKPKLVFVRLSRSTILDNSLIPWLEKVFRESTVEPSQLCFQVTEAVAARHMTQIVRQANALNELGFKFAIDQIGANPDVKDMLDLVPMQYARIAAALSQRVARDKSVEHQVSKIVCAAKARGIFVIADRIENAATMATLSQMKVEFMQGDYLRRDNIVIEDTMTVCKPILPPTRSP
jgi:diguanylate cyclase (GGDEF)-like protein